MRYTYAMAALMLSVSAFVAPARADATITVKLADKGGMMDMSKAMGMGMGMHGNMQMAMMSIEVDQVSVPAGKVTFNVTNVSKETIHEMLISPISGLDVTLPFSAAENRVDEEASGDLGEVSELEPGKSGSLTLELKPGLYVLYCNIPGHFDVGMWKTIEVK
jgi:uncharacterized cupredoxin-like copper-binding protein